MEGENQFYSTSRKHHFPILDQKKYGKSYPSRNEESAAEKAYEASAAAVARHNADPKQIYKTATNNETDMNADELAKQGGYVDDDNLNVSKPKQKVLGTIPVNISYVGMMQPVKQQGKCGACWAFRCGLLINFIIGQRKKLFPSCQRHSRARIRQREKRVEAAALRTEFRRLVC